MESGYYLTYNSGAGTFGFTGGETLFDHTRTAVLFSTRKEARAAMKTVRSRFGNFTRKGWRRFRISESGNAYLRNR